MQASDHRYRAREALRGNWANAVLVGFLVWLLAGGMGFEINIKINGEDLRYLPEFLHSPIMTYMAILAGAASVLNVVHMILGGPISMGAAQYNLNLMDGREAGVNDLFSQFNRFGDALVMHLTTQLFVFLWSLLFIIPGIVASYSYAMAPYILLEDPDCSGYESLKRSKALMDGHKGELFFLDLSFFGWSLLAGLTLGIGYLWLNPYTSAARASFYRSLREPRIPAYE